MTRELSSDRATALLIFIPALLSLVIVLHHPVLRHDDWRSGTAIGAGIARIAATNAAFHAVILLFVGTQALGLYGFAERLGLSRLSVRAGVALYALATIFMFVPGIMDGFVTPLLGKRCATDPTFCATGLANSLVFEWAAIQAFTKVSLALQALGLLSWSVTLGFVPDWRRWVGISGALLTIIPLFILGTMTQPIGPKQLAEIIMFEALWAMAAAILVWKGGHVFQR